MRSSRSLSSCFIAVFLVFSLIISSLACYADADKLDKQRTAKHNRPAYKEGELLIKFKDGTSSNEMAAFASKNGLQQKEYFESMNAGLYSLKKGAIAAKALKALADNDEIELVQPNYLYYPIEIPSDKYFDNLWGLNNDVHPGVDIDAPEAWDITQGSEDIIVAVIDTGVYIYHPELKDRMWKNNGEIGTDSNGRNKSYNHIDDDGNGYVDDVNGWNFYRDSKYVYNDEYDDEHGTHVAGTIAASANSDGVIGVAPNVKIMPLKFLGPNGGTTADAIKAINYAKNMGAKIVNASWGGPPEGNGNDILLKEAIEQSGMLFVAAAGNGDEHGIGYDIDTTPDYPASYDSNNILTVAAVDSSGNLADFSNYGAVSVDIGAPGVDIYSTVPAAGEGIAAVGSSGEYDAFVAAFGLEDLVRQSDADDLLSKALDGVASDAPILLVDDDGNGTNWDGVVYRDVYGVYDTALANLGYTNVDVVHVASDTSDGPSYLHMRSYDAVIWFTGETFGYDDEKTLDWVTTLTDQDQLNLIDYLSDTEKNGRLVLFGQDALFDIEDSELVNDYLGIEFDYSDYGKNQRLEGADSTVFESVYYDIYSGPEYQRDYLLPISDAVKPLLYYPEDPDAYYSYLDGTSMAAPHVTGIAALLLSKNPDMSAVELKEAIVTSGTLLNSLDGVTSSGKMANAFNALKAVAPGKPTNLIASKAGSNITLTWTGREAGDFKEYIVERKIGNGSYAVIGRTTGKNYTDSGIDTSKTYRYRVKAVDDYSNESDYSNEVVGNVGSSSDNNGGSSSGGRSGGGGSSAPAVPNRSIDSKVQLALKNASAEKNITVSLTEYNSAESATMSMETLGSLNKSGKFLVLTGSSAELTIPAAALMTEEVKKYINDNNARLDINAKEIKGEEAKKLLSSNTNGIVKVGDRVFDFSIELKTAKETVDIKKLAEELKLGIKLNETETAGIDTNKLGVYYYNSEKKAWEYVGGVFNARNRTITFDTGHFSKYAVMRTDKSYADIAKHWAKSDIELMAARHIVEGINDGQFAPDAGVTRAEVIRMLVNVLRYDPARNIDLITPSVATFKDVSVDDPDFPFIETAVKYGITNGNVDGTFRPKDLVTREQLTAMIIRAVKIESDSDLSILPFTDKDKIPGWAAKSIIAAYERGLVMGIGGNEFGVGSTATRAQATVIVKRVMEKMGLLQVPATITGKLTVSNIEGQHYELETEDGIYVLLYDGESKYLAKMLSSMVGKDIEVSGYEQEGYNQYQRGKAFKAISVKAK